MVVGFLSSDCNNAHIHSDYNRQWSLLFWLSRCCRTNSVESLLFAWFYLAAVLGLAFFFSSLFKSSSISILVTVILLLFGFTLIQTLVSDLVGIEPWFILTYGSGIIGNILNSPYPLPKVTDIYDVRASYNYYYYFRRIGSSRTRHHRNILHRHSSLGTTAIRKKRIQLSK